MPASLRKPGDWKGEVFRGASARFTIDGQEIAYVSDTSGLLWGQSREELYLDGGWHSLAKELQYEDTEVLCMASPYLPGPGGHVFIGGECACGQTPKSDPERCSVDPSLRPYVPGGKIEFSMRVPVMRFPE